MATSMGNPVDFTGEGGYVDTVTKQAYDNWKNQQDQMDWARASSPRMKLLLTRRSTVRCRRGSGSVTGRGRPGSLRQDLRAGDEGADAVCA
jgi:hypothetical protein